MEKDLNGLADLTESRSSAFDMANCTTERECVIAFKVLGDLADGPGAKDPVLISYDNWGQKINTVYTSEGWRRLKDLAAAEGIIGIHYERKHGSYSRVHGFAKILLMTPDLRSVGCPAA